MIAYRFWTGVAWLLKAFIIAFPYIVALAAITLAGWINNWTWQGWAAFLLGTLATAFDSGWQKARKEHPLEEYDG